MLAVDLAATVFLGIEGGLAAIASSLDLFGVMVLAFCTALGGGVIRDLLIGAVPPNAVKDARYASAAFLGGLIAFAMHNVVSQIPTDTVCVIDAVGLALFCVAGAAKADEYEINALLSILMGTITGVGGGTIRDVLLSKVPTILWADVYATAAMAGAAVTVVCIKLKLPRGYAMLLGAIVCFVLRMVAYLNHWNLPSIGKH